MEWNNVATSFCYRQETIRRRLDGYGTGCYLVLSYGSIACFVSERMMERLQVDRHVGYNLNGPGVYLVFGEDGRLSYWMDGAFLAGDDEAKRWCGFGDFYHACIDSV